jgi:hypothetical protein
MSCWKHSCDEAISFGKDLHKALKAVEAGGVAKDLFMRQGATELVMKAVEAVENEQGHRLDAVVPLLMEQFRGHLWGWRSTCHEFEISRVERWEGARRDTAATYPTTVDWDKHMAEYWKITQAWESAMAEVDRIMADVGIWRPVLAEEIKVRSSVICLDYLRAKDLRL